MQVERLPPPDEMDERRTSFLILFAIVRYNEDVLRGVVTPSEETPVSLQWERVASTFRANVIKIRLIPCKCRWES